MNIFRRSRREGFLINFSCWIGLRINRLRIATRRQPLLSLGIALGAVLFSILVTRSVVNALSLEFVQSDWSGGADEVTTIDSTHLTGWTKYFSKTTGVNTTTPGEIKLNITISQP